MKHLFCITTTVPGVETPQNMRAFAASEGDLIDFANYECCLAGGPALFERAGMEELCCYHPETDAVEYWLSREWEEGEELATALEVLRESGIFLAFDATDEGRQRFVQEADARGCGDQARACLEETVE